MLPRSHKLDSFLFVHGSPRNPLSEYIFPEDIYNHRKMERLFQLVEKYCFQGHTHVPGVFTEGYQFYAPDEIDNEYTLGEGKVMINVGSVGQPRDGDPRACYVILDDGVEDPGHRAARGGRRLRQEARARRRARDPGTPVHVPKPAPTGPVPASPSAASPTTTRRRSRRSTRSPSSNPSSATASARAAEAARPARPSPNPTRRAIPDRGISPLESRLEVGNSGSGIRDRLDTTPRFAPR